MPADTPANYRRPSATIASHPPAPSHASGSAPGSAPGSARGPGVAVTPAPAVDVLTPPSDPLPPPSSNNNGVAADPPQKKRQKRNKPTLSCEQCVERKTKCDRNRPRCLACIKRQSDCRYSEVANAIAAKGKPKPRKPAKQELAAEPQTSEEYPSSDHIGVSSATSSVASPPLLLSNFAHSKQPPSHFFHIGTGHPFGNYWTCQGGLQEVIRVLPSKSQADILISKYFEAVDPVYPLVNKGHFYADYERFWSLPAEEKEQFDAASLGLHFAMYAMATQFLQTDCDRERIQISEFYASASHQSLRLSSYLNSTVLTTVQTMVLLCYFLMNDNHATDAFAFAGVLLRQAFAIGLNRDPDLIAPRASPAEKQQRRKVWQAVMLQDTFLTVLLKLPPTATCTDVSVDSLTEDPYPTDSPQSTHAATPAAAENRMSISMIAPDPNAGGEKHSSSPYDAYTPANSPSDIAYIRSMWRLVNLVQRSFCIPRSLHRPICSTPQERSSLLGQYRSLYASFPLPLTADSPETLAEYASTKSRLLRQNLFLRSNYWHCTANILAEESESTGLYRDIRGAVEAALTAIRAFFNCWELLHMEVGVWWVFQHRAFEEALLIANLIRTSNSNPVKSHESLFAQAKDSVRYMLEILEHIRLRAPEMQKSRIDVLSKAFDEIG